ncbi:MAG: xanthine dehydrogenase family protein molybdopterin-binding subunit [Deltaproteobacteria bacterium]|nr:xanthine dehydrogenase family protein molybdopterin-binding subunit [Deltaproteobacteria bacterium]
MNPRPFCVGKPIPRPDALEKVTGQALFLSDLDLPGLLHGKILRSPFPHARILRIDTEKAKRLRGVKAVITADDTPRIPFSSVRELADKYPLATDKVRFIGDEVAAVAAVDGDVAQEALSLIEVEYEELPAVFDVFEALKEGAPEIHEKGNVALRLRKKLGDVEKGFREAALVVEDDYSTQAAAHCCLETRGCVAQWTAASLTVWATTQIPHVLKSDLAHALGIPPRKVRVIQALMGGAFGSRLCLDSKEIIASLLSKKTGRPVRLVNTREEEFRTSRIRYPFFIHLKTGVRADGTLCAREVRVITENGAYHEKGAAVLTNAALTCALHYRIENVRFEGTLVYTNHVYGGAFRGFGNPQITFAIESQMDQIAAKLNLNPLELRLRNASEKGDTVFGGTEISSCAMKSCIERAARAVGWPHKHHEDEGIGIACVSHPGGGHRMYKFNAADAHLEILPSGEVNLFSGASEIGQGANAALIQICAEELGVQPEQIKIVLSDSDLTPYDLGAFASRTTFVHGNAVAAAAREAKKSLVEIAAQQLEANPSDLEAMDGRIFVRGTPSRSVEISEVARRAYFQNGTPIAGHGRFVDRVSEPNDPLDYGDMFPTFAYGAHAVRLRVDRDTGKIRILKIAAAHDVGRTINPLLAEGQVFGAVAQGIGFSIHEELIFDQGAVRSDSLRDYRVLTTEDVPEVEVILVEGEDPSGPLGAKGLGEPGLVPTAPAIANAVFDAIGVRVEDLPLDPIKILAALRGGQGHITFHIESTPLKGEQA